MPSKRPSLVHSLSRALRQGFQILRACPHPSQPPPPTRQPGSCSREGFAPSSISHPFIEPSISLRSSCMSTFFYYVLLSRSPWLSFWELWRLCARWMQGVTCAPERACLFLLPRRQRALVCWLVNSGHINARLWNVTCHSWDTETPKPLHLPQHHTELSRRKYATKQQHTLIKDAVVVFLFL